MADDFLSAFLGSSNRARILRIFALNQPQVFTAAQAARRAGVKLTSAGREIRTLERVGVLKKAKLEILVGKGKRALAGKQKEAAWTFNPDLAYAPALAKFIHEVSPLQHRVILDALKRVGRLSTVVLSGVFMGDPTRPADLIVALDGFNETRLEAAIRGVEPAIGREIRYAAFSTPEFRYRLTVQDRLVRDTLDYPHLVLLDRTRLL